MLRQSLRSFLEKEAKPNHEQWEKDRMVSREIWQKAGEMGFLNIDMPIEYGGGGLDASFSMLIAEEVARSGFSGLGFSLHSDIVAPYILKYGSEEQKQKFLGKMATGEWIACIGMTEPGAGSDLKSLQTTAKDMGDHYLVNGSKTFITNGYMSDFVLLACRTNPGTAKEGISLILVESDRKGYSKGNPFKKLGMKSNDTCELFFEDVEVPKSNLLGTEGAGFRLMMTELARERLSVAVGAIGGAEAALEATIQYVQERRAFKQMIAGFQNTQFKLAECATTLQIHQSYVDTCVATFIDKKLSPEQASMAKYSATDMHCKIVDECVQLHGGYGYMWEYFVTQNYADSRVARIYAGTNEIMKLLIARGLLPIHFAELKQLKKAKAAELA
ncbi:UNVERIFIED_CONTAM: hypothetical protein GTU68_027382 [Idotea baltica]|nr:hypothetical protein [Idotea baltica]